MARKKKRPEVGEAAFSETAQPEEQARLTPVDVQQKVFRLAFRGYNERDVDEFLDRVTEEIAGLHEENKRLREQLAEGGGPGDLEGAERQAEAIVRQAREHAARLIQDAERTPTTAPAPGVSAVFLLQERQFLQQMASLIQDHAHRLKEEARRAREAGQEGPAEAVPTEAAVALEAAEASEPPREEPSESAPVGAGIDEPTASWAPVESPSATPADRPEGEPPQKASDEDPLVSAWESAFTGGPEDGTEASPVARSEERRKRGDSEPSLRELFWGEEG